MKILKYIGIAFALVLILAGAGLTFALVKEPNMRPPSTEKVEATPERLARGKYIVEQVSICFSCHGQHDYSKLGAPLVEGSQGGPGFCYTQPDFPGTLCPPNISPDPEHGLANWTDGEIIRAIREGISRDGRPLFVMMPYTEYHSMSDEDVKSVVAYLRTIPAVAKGSPRTELGFPTNLIAKFSATPLEGPVPHPKKGTLEYGKYMTDIAGCRGCHGERGQGYAGGFEMKGPWGTIVAANITPDPDTGIGKMTREQFIARFKAYLSVDPSAEAAVKSPMPWSLYAQMEEEDLGAIYDFLRSVPPVNKAELAAK